jgi:hypothetical protein
VLVVHIGAAGAWIGVDVMVAVLVAAGWISDDPATRGAAYQTLGRFAVAPMLVSSLLCATTGLLLGLMGKWGLARYWWVLVKLVITLVLCTLIIVALRPGMGEVTAVGVTIAEGGTTTKDLTTLFYPPAVSLSALSVALVLSVFKPWGRVRRRHAASAHQVRRSAGQTRPDW